MREITNGVESNKIGKTDLLVHPIEFCSNAVRGVYLSLDLHEEDGRDVIHKALDQELTFLDGAFIYGLERSKELIGEVLKKRKPFSEAVIATKAAHKSIVEQETLDNSPAFLKESVY